MRQQVYSRAMLAGKTHEQALLTASVFRNCYFMGCGYQEDVMTETQKYWDNEWVEHYVKISQM